MKTHSDQHTSEPEASAFASLALRLVGDPLSNLVPPHLNDLRPTENEALHFLLDRLHLTLAELSAAKNVSRMLEAISQRLSHASLSGTRLAATRNRLGDRGELRNADYSIRFESGFSDKYAELGIRKSHVETTVRHADLYEHVSPMPGDDSTQSAISLFARRVTGESQRSFVSLVLAQRSGGTLTIISAWRLWRDLLDPSPESLVDLLRRLVTHAGVGFRILNGPPTHFAYRVVVATDQRYVGAPGLPLASTFEIVGLPHGHSASLVTVMRFSPLGVLQIAIAYAIDFTVYRQALVHQDLL
jgi:hypothetical protein